jgi:hypothetical protein
MNIRQSRKNIGKDFRLDPPPESRTFTPMPVPIAQEFNRWRFEVLKRRSKIVRFAHALGYFRDVPFNLITGHEPDGSYTLKCRLVINGPRVNLVPVRQGRPPEASPAFSAEKSKGKN